MEHKSFTDLSITAAKKPVNPHLFIETNSSGTFYLVDATDTDGWYKTTDKGDNFGSSLGPDNGRVVYAAYHDRDNNNIYFAFDQANEAGWHYIDMDDSDSDNDIQTITGAGAALFDTIDVIKADTIRWVYSFDIDAGPDNGDCFIYFQDTLGASDSQDMGLYAARTHAASYCVKDSNDDVWFLWKWSDENVEVWKYDEGAGTITELEDLGANIDLPDDRDQRSLAYDSTNNLIYFLLKDTDDANKIKLWYYDITGDSAAEVCELDVVMMQNRNTATASIMEKAYHISAYEVYQLHESIPFQFHFIAKPDSDAVFIGISDTFLVNNDGDMWEFEDVSNYVVQFEMTHEVQDAPTAIFKLHNDYPLAANMLIKITDMFSNHDGSSSQTIFEGLVQEFNDHLVQTAPLRSPAFKDLDKVFPVGDYSGRTDEIIVDIIEAYFGYITEGTLSNGTAMGTITFAGDLSAREIFDDFAIVDNFVWYLGPTGLFYYDAGAVDSTENIAETDYVINVVRLKGPEIVNYVNIKGGFVSGSQITGTVAEDITHQNKFGKNPVETTFSFLDTAALCTTTNTNAESRWDSQATIITFLHRDSAMGPVQPGEEITFQYNKQNPNISSAQYKVQSIRYNPRTKITNFMVSNQIL